ncbi:MAG: phosphate signaling complex protein PhoU [Elusimicrobia bacterium]|nr:phosphate signaling complex protein PhoU [Elusimicrobiota bacterium]
MFEEKMINLKREISEHTSLVESMIEKSIRGLVNKDKELLREVKEKDEPRANDYEIEIDELCTNIVAQFQPKGKDLRTVLMILKMNNDLERIGDHAVNISESCMYLLNHPMIKVDVDIPKIADIAKTMLKNSINSFMNEDAELAKSVCESDVLIDKLKYEAYNKVIASMTSDSKIIKYSLNILRINNNIERIADLSTNICEEVIFMVEGKVIKHHRNEDDGNISKKKVLFICTHNSARSQMAEALLKTLYSDKYYVYSAGTEPAGVNPYAVKVMAEIGIDISDYQSKNLDSFSGKRFDFVITVCDNAKETCPFLPGAEKYKHKSFSDPAQTKGTDEEILAVFRRSRDEIKEWIEKNF